MAVYIGSAIIFLILIWFPIRIPQRLNDKPTAYYIDPALKDLAEKMTNIADTLRGEDHRLIQWDATEETAAAQPLVCPSYMPVAASQMANYSSWSSFLQRGLLKMNDPILYQMIEASLDVAIFCITDNPINREIFADTPPTSYNATIHDAVVALLQIPDLASLAAHLIYIATFANAKNHAGFLQAQAVSALERLLLESDHPPVAIMWAAAALQNLAASYCTTRNSEKETAEIGRCDWEWHMYELSKQIPHYDLIVSLSQSMIIDATPVRKAILSSPQLIDRLVKWSCQGPVRGRKSPQNPFPGKNAQSGSKDQHEMSWNMVPWAATGVLKNFVLDPDARSRVLSNYNQSLACFCFMSQSKDWLERNKGEGVLHHLRVDSDPCWFNFDSNRDGGKVLCVDRIFVDQSGGTCADTESGGCKRRGDDSQNKQTSAKSACCQCGGGDEYKTPREK
jgi:hypothetical protein